LLLQKKCDEVCLKKKQKKTMDTLAQARAAAQIEARAARAAARDAARAGGFQHQAVPPPPPPPPPAAAAAAAPAVVAGRPPRAKKAVAFVAAADAAAVVPAVNPLIIPGGAADGGAAGGAGAGGAAAVPVLNPFVVETSARAKMASLARSIIESTQFASDFDPRRYRHDSIVIEEAVMNKIGMHALTQEQYTKLMQNGFGSRETLVLQAQSVTVVGRITNSGETDSTVYDPLKSFTDARGETYTVGRRLAAGSYGIVHALTSHPDRVVKIMFGDKPQNDAAVLLETIMQLLVSENLRELEASKGASFVGRFAKAAGVYSICSFVSDGRRYLLLVMDKVSTPLHKYVGGRGLTVIERSTVNAHVTYQIANTLKHLVDTMSFNHRDLKCDNVMVSEVDTILNSNRVKFAQASFIDFGMSRLVYNGRLFSSNWKLFMKTLSDDKHVNPDQDMLFFLLSLVWEDGCGLSVARRDCSGRVDPALYVRLIHLLMDSNPVIKTKYEARSYEGEDAHHNPRWWDFYTDAFNVDADITPMGLRSGREVFLLKYNFLSTVKESMKTYLQSIAQPGATGPFYFGRRRRRQ
jgi:hypothetical protein